VAYFYKILTICFKKQQLFGEAQRALAGQSEQCSEQTHHPLCKEECRIPARQCWCAKLTSSCLRTLTTSHRCASSDSLISIVSPELRPPYSASCKLLRAPDWYCVPGTAPELRNCPELHEIDCYINPETIRSAMAASTIFLPRPTAFSSVLNTVICLPL
jgi:hypothetical protein